MKVNSLPKKDRSHPNTRDSGSAMKTKIASFNGQQFVAERYGDELLIFIVHADPLQPMIMGTQDRQGVRSVADLNRHNRRAFGQ